MLLVEGQEEAIQVPVLLLLVVVEQEDLEQAHHCQLLLVQHIPSPLVLEVLLLQALVQRAQTALIRYLALLLLLEVVLVVDTEIQQEPLVVMVVQAVAVGFVKRLAQVVGGLVTRRLLLLLRHKVAMVEPAVNRVLVVAVGPRR